MIIEKVASRDNYRRTPLFFDRARDGFAELLRCTGAERKATVLLPAYIGWSPREGSGVFDPVVNSGLPYAFYGLDERLHVDMDDLGRKLASGGVGVCVIIHYFGHADPNYERIVKMAHGYGCTVLEDEAHALFTDLVDGRTGRLGDASIYSLHKMLPVKSGGVLAVNRRTVECGEGKSRDGDVLSRYDLYSIAARRKANTAVLRKLLAGVDGISPLWEYDDSRETLQTFPVVIERADRDRLYTEMNDAGYGVVSLYHTLIPDIRPDEYPAACRLSHRIMNLPVHQDVTENDLSGLVETLRRKLEETER